MSLDQKPENGEMPESASAPMANVQVGDFHFAGRAAHFLNVLRMYGVDDAAGAKEEQRLEERMREQMEHPAVYRVPMPSAIIM